LNLAGILPAIVTPIDEYEEFAPRSLEVLLERLYEAGVHGVYVSGQTGEGLLGPTAHREQVIEVAIRNTPPDRIVIAHVGSHRTSDAIRLAKHSARLGAAAISSLPPIGAYSLKEVKQYYETLAAATDCPVLVYYFPELSRPIASLEAQRELLTIPNVVGIKFTSFDLYSLSKLKQGGAVVFNGHDEVLAAGLLMGADGGIGSFYNLVPELFVDVYNKAKSGDWDGAIATQSRINELIEIVLRFPMLPAIKTMLSWSGIDCGSCFLPRRRLSADEETRLAALLAQSSFAESLFAKP